MKNAIVGSWEIEAVESRNDDGSVDHPFGPAPRGLLVYTPEGLVTVHLAGTNRARFASEDHLKGTPDELKMAFATYVAYFGRFELNEAEGVILHHVEGSAFPNWVGNVQRRNISLEGDRLTLSTQPMMIGDRTRTSVLVWRRSARASSAAS
jgi:hypothetical protein